MNVNKNPKYLNADYQVVPLNKKGINTRKLSHFKEIIERIEEEDT